DVVSRAFFFQAADGIRVFHVTGVQTCALPISARRTGTGARARCALPRARRGGGARRDDTGRGAVRVGRVALGHGGGGGRGPAVRSEERRVGKEEAAGAGGWSEQ